MQSGVRLTRQASLACLYLSYLAFFAAAVLGLLAIWLPTGTAALAVLGSGLVLALVGGALLLPRRRPLRASGGRPAPEGGDPVGVPADPSRPDSRSR